MKATRPRLEGLTSGQRALPALGTGYSWFVKLAKFALPVVALVLVAVVITSLQEDPLQEQIVALPPEEKTTPGAIELTTAKYEGVDDKGRAYTLTADKAVRADDKTTTMLFEKPKADIALGQSGWIAVHADQGSFDSAQSRLNLTGNVKIFHDGGYELHLSTVDIDIKARAAISSQPARGQGPVGEITGKTLEVTGNGDKIIFGGPATLTLHGLSGKRAG